MQSEIGARVSADMGVGTVPIRPLRDGRCLTAETVKAATVHVSIDGIGRAGGLCTPTEETFALWPWSYLWAAPLVRQRRKAAERLAPWRALLAVHRARNVACALVDVMPRDVMSG